MNIFVVDPDPKIAATMLCDKHVVKMILETAQMLCTVSRQHGYDMKYRSTHSKHPCNLWLNRSKQNWDWLITHGLAMCEEYTKRYGRRHKSQDVIEACDDLSMPLPSIGLTPFAQAMPAQYRDPCAVTAYRAYYHGEKAKFATWKTKTPDWWNYEKRITR